MSAPGTLIATVTRWGPPTPTERQRATSTPATTTRAPDAIVWSTLSTGRRSASISGTVGGPSARPAGGITHPATPPSASTTAHGTRPSPRWNHSEPEASPSPVAGGGGGQVGGSWPATPASATWTVQAEPSQ